MSINGNSSATGPVTRRQLMTISRQYATTPEEESQSMTTANAREHSTATTNDANAELEVDHAALDGPRGEWQTAEETSARAQNQLSIVLERLETNAERRSADEAALQAAIEQQAELKRAIKTSAEQRETLRKARSKAQREVDAARKQAQAAEARYDEALLVEVLAAQKSKDLSAFEDQAQVVGDSADAEAAPIAQSTAQMTAAAVTARNAGA